MCAFKISDSKYSSYGRKFIMYLLTRMILSLNKVLIMCIYKWKRIIESTSKRNETATNKQFIIKRQSQQGSLHNLSFVAVFQILIHKVVVTPVVDTVCIPPAQHYVLSSAALMSPRPKCPSTIYFYILIASIYILFICSC